MWYYSLQPNIDPVQVLKSMVYIDSFNLLIFHSFNSGSFLKTIKQTNVTMFFKNSWLLGFYFYSNPPKKKELLEIIPLTTTYSIKGKVNEKIGLQRTLKSR